MRFSKIEILIVFLAVIPIAAAVPGRVLARVGAGSITVAEFERRYSLVLDKARTADSLAARLHFLDRLIGEATLLAAGRDQGLTEQPEIMMAGYLAWRNVLLTAVTKAHFIEEVRDDLARVEAEYQYRNTALLNRIIVVPDSLLAVQYREALSRGAPFESLALRVYRPRHFMDRPWELGWKYTPELDPSYARLAYQLSPGDISPPIRTADGYLLVQLLAKDYRPDHGHFERVKYYQLITDQLMAAEAVPIEITSAILEEWALAVPIKWRRWGMRKVLRSGILLQSPNATAIEPPDPELLITELFVLYDESYTLDWLLTRLELLPPDGRNGTIDNRAFRALLVQVLRWDRMMDLAAALPSADSLMQAAEESRQATLRGAVMDSVLSRLARAFVPPADSLQAHLAAHPHQYLKPALVDIDEIVVDDSAQAAMVMELYLAGTPFQELAREYTLREWAREKGGRLEWVPVSIYGPAADSIANSSPGELVGPVPVDGYYVLAKIRGRKPAGLPETEALTPRLRHDWMQAHSGQLRRAWVHDLQETSYPVYIDTSLLLPAIEVSVPRPLKPAWPGSVTLAADSAANVQLAPPDSALADTLTIAWPDSITMAPDSATARQLARADTIQMDSLPVMQPDSVGVDSLAIVAPDSASIKTNPALPD